MGFAKCVQCRTGQNSQDDFFRSGSRGNLVLRLVIECQSERQRFAIANTRGRVNYANDPGVVGILQEDERGAGVKFGDRSAVGKRSLLGRVGGALPFANANNAEWTSSETCCAERDAKKRHSKQTRHDRHGNFPPAPQLAGVIAIMGCVAD